MTMAVTFSRQNDVGSRALLSIWGNLVLEVILVSLFCSIKKKHFILGDYSMHSHDLWIVSGSVIIGRNWMLVTMRT